MMRNKSKIANRCLLILICIIFANPLYSFLYNKLAVYPVNGVVLYSFDEKDFKQLESSKVIDQRILIETKTGSFARVKFHDKSEIRICPSSAVLIAEKEVFVLFGNVFFNIHKKTAGKMIVRTSVAVANLRGTEFEVEVKDKVSSFFVYEGLLDIRTKNFRNILLLQAGKTISIRKGIFTSRTKPFNSNRRNRFIWDTVTWNKMQEKYSEGKNNTQEFSSKVLETGVERLKNPEFRKFTVIDENMTKRPQDTIKRFDESGFEKRSPWLMKKVGDNYRIFLGPNQITILKEKMIEPTKESYLRRFDSNPKTEHLEVDRKKMQLENYRNTINQYWNSHNVKNPDQL